jgi:hypothetical protein
MRYVLFVSSIASHFAKHLRTAHTLLGENKAAYTLRKLKLKSVRIYVVTAFPEWQEICLDAVRQAYSPEADKVDDVKVREVLTEKGPIKDKRAMPYVQLVKVCTICSGLFHLLSLLFAHIGSNIVDTSGPGSPVFEYRNVQTTVIEMYQLPH